MLSVAKIAAGQEQYYLDQVARGIEDYYSGRGETPGRWTGSAVAHSVSDTETMLGALPDDVDAAGAWRSAAHQLRQLRPGLTPHQSPERYLRPERRLGLTL